MPPTLPLAAARNGNLARLRARLRSKRLHAYIVPHADEHQSEYLAPSEEKLAFVSNFTGSAGTALVFASPKRKNLLWTDNRYFIQAESQLAAAEWGLMKVGEPGVPTLEAYISQGTILNDDDDDDDDGEDNNNDEDAEDERNGGTKTTRKRHKTEEKSTARRKLATTPPFVVGINSRVCTMRFYEKLVGDLAAWNDKQQSQISSSSSSSSAAAAAGREVSDRPRQIRLELIEDDVVEEVWREGRPARPCNPILDFSKRCGKPFSEKIARAETLMRRFGARYLLLSALDDIAWLLNARGSDIVYNPLFFSYLLHDAKTHRTTLFTDDDASQLLSSMNGLISLKPYAQVFPTLVQLESGEAGSAERIWLDVNSTNCLAMQSIQKKSSPPVAMFRATTNPIKCEKSAKTKEETAGMRDAQFKDAVSLCRFFHRLDGLLRYDSNSSSSSSPHVVVLDEWTLAGMLEEERRKFPDYRGKSFETISAFGPNAAVVHYKVESQTTARTFDPSTSSPTIYLLDAGGHYDFGTTDTTRTVMLRGKKRGDDEEEEEEVREARRVFTHVLKAHIALAQACFPRGIHAHKLDPITRAPLWAAGLDYKHGTGHGVMTFGSVHELPPLISSQCPAPSTLHPDLDVNLVPGVCVTDEPGHYVAGRFGFRYESLLSVQEMEEGERGDFCRFEYLTPVPVCDLSLVEPTLLTHEEKAWLNRHHKRCWEELSPLFERTGERGVLEWLRRETRELL